MPETTIEASARGVSTALHPTNPTRSPVPHVRPVRPERQQRPRTRRRKAALALAASDGSMGDMIALVFPCQGFEVAEVQAACTAAGAYVANDNAPGQIVVAGSSEALQRLRTALAEHTGKIRDVNVGAAYHSPHMRAAEAPLADA